MFNWSINGDRDIEPKCIIQHLKAQSICLKQFKGPVQLHCCLIFHTLMGGGGALLQELIERNHILCTHWSSWQSPHRSSKVKLEGSVVSVWKAVVVASSSLFSYKCSLSSALVFSFLFGKHTGTQEWSTFFCLCSQSLTFLLFKPTYSISVGWQSSNSKQIAAPGCISYL